MTLNITTITPVVDGFQPLKQASVEEGFNMLRRLEENWLNQHNRFDKPGEMLLGALINGKLVGVCGLNIDPFVQEQCAGRVRHLYVAAAYRSQAVGSLLLSEIIAHAAQNFDHLYTHAPQAAFRFYQRAGFVPTEGIERVTHCLRLRQN